MKLGRLKTTDGVSETVRVANQVADGAVQDERREIGRIGEERVVLLEWLITEGLSGTKGSSADSRMRPSRMRGRFTRKWSSSTRLEDPRSTRYMPFPWV